MEQTIYYGIWNNRINAWMSGPDYRVDHYPLEVIAEAQVLALKRLNQFSLKKEELELEYSVRAFGPKGLPLERE